MIPELVGQALQIAIGVRRHQRLRRFLQTLGQHRRLAVEVAAESMHFVLRLIQREGERRSADRENQAKIQAHT